MKKFRTRLLILVWIISLMTLAEIPALAGKDSNNGKRPAGEEPAPTPEQPPADGTGDGTGEEGSSGDTAGGEQTTVGGGTSGGSGESSGGTTSNTGTSAGGSSTVTNGFTLEAAATPLQISALAACPTELFSGSFELEGNTLEDIVDDVACSGDDWDSIYGGGSSAIESTFVNDKIGKEGDDTYFFQGGSKDIHDLQGDPHEWHWRTNDESPDKDDITNAYAAAYDAGGDFVLTYGADRYSESGDAKLGFWFFQQEVGLADDGISFTGQHQVNDVLIQVNYSGGGKIAGASAYRWVGSGGSHGSLDLLAAANPPDCKDSPIGATLCATVNAENIDPAWPYSAKSSSHVDAGIIPSNNFFEGGINITKELGEELCFSSFVATTRTSTAFDARLKDFALGDFQVCPQASGRKFQDSNGDGDQDAGEPGVEGVNVHVFNGSVHEHLTTDATGAWSFSSATLGLFTFCEEIPAGWEQSFPTLETPSAVDCSGHGPNLGLGYQVRLGPGGDVTGLSFGNFQRGSISGEKFNDTNNNGTRDPNEVALAGWEIHLFGTDGQGNAVHRHTTTGATGGYTFTGVAPGSYTLCETITTGWRQSFPSATTSGAADCSTHGAGAGGSAAGGFGHSVTLTSGQTIDSLLFGNNFTAVLPVTLHREAAAIELPRTGSPVEFPPALFLAAISLMLGALALSLSRRRTLEAI